MSKIDWSNKDEYIKLFYKETFKEPLAEFLGISVDSLKKRAKLLGLNKSTKTSSDTNSRKRYVSNHEYTTNSKQKTSQSNRTAADSRARATSNNESTANSKKSSSQRQESVTGSEGNYSRTRGSNYAGWNRHYSYYNTYYNNGGL